MHNLLDIYRTRVSMDITLSRKIEFVQVHVRVTLVMYFVTKRCETRVQYYHKRRSYHSLTTSFNERTWWKFFESPAKTSDKRRIMPNFHWKY